MKVGMDFSLMRRVLLLHEERGFSGHNGTLEMELLDHTVETQELKEFLLEDSEIILSD